MGGRCRSSFDRLRRVRKPPPALFLLARHLPVHLCAQAHSDDADENAAVDSREIHGRLVACCDHGTRFLHRQGQPEAPRDVIGRAQNSDDSHGKLPAGRGMDRLPGATDRPIASGDHQQVQVIAPVLQNSLVATLRLRVAALHRESAALQMAGDFAKTILRLTGFGIYDEKRSAHAASESYGAMGASRWFS